MDELTIADVRRLRLNPGDTLVLRVRDLTPDVAEHCVEMLRSTFPDNRALVLDPDADIGVVERQLFQ